MKYIQPNTITIQIGYTDLLLMSLTGGTEQTGNANYLQQLQTDDSTNEEW